MLRSIRDMEAVFSEAQRTALISSGRGEPSKEIIENFSCEVVVITYRNVEAPGIGTFDIGMAPSNCLPELGADIWLKHKVSLVGGSISLTRWGGKDYRAAALQIKRLLKLE